ncbi:MAG TPA: hypothetical protein VGH09_12450 [Solirubrobacteraceae bacterium]|jgi:hypothetical protein
MRLPLRNRITSANLGPRLEDELIDLLGLIPLTAPQLLWVRERDITIAVRALRLAIENSCPPGTELGVMAAVRQHPSRCRIVDELEDVVA